MTVAENIVLATEPRRGGVLLDYGAARKRGARARPSGSASHVDPDARDRGHHRRPAAARRDPEGALPRRRHPHPRRADGGAHAAGGGRALRDPARARRARACRSSSSRHKLNEVLDIADRITVLRRGKNIDTIPREGATEAGLARLMVGREVLLRVDKHAVDARRGAAARRGPRRPRRPRRSKRCAASRFEVRAGEIVASPASTATARPS